MPGLIKHIPRANSHFLLSDSLLPTRTPQYLPQGAPCRQPSTQTLDTQGQWDEDLRPRRAPSVGVVTVLRAAGRERSREDIHVSHGDWGHAAQQRRGHPGRPQVRGLPGRAGWALRQPAP